MSAPRREVVRAAGGVVSRVRDGGAEVLVVHRPRYGDWSFPKGKCEPGESDVAAALREVEEETGYRCSVGDELAPSWYVDRKGRPKRVRWWRMAVVDVLAWLPDDEVDERKWVSTAEARALLTYPGDAALLDGLDGGGR